MRKCPDDWSTIIGFRPNKPENSGMADDYGLWTVDCGLKTNT